MLELLVRGNSDLVVTLDSLESARKVDVTLVLNLPFGSDLHRHSVLGTLECAWSDCPLNIGKCAVVNCETVAEFLNHSMEGMTSTSRCFRGPVAQRMCGF